MSKSAPSASTRQRLLERAQAKLYSIAGGSIDSGNVKAASLTTAQRIEYFKTSEFRRWVAAERAAGNEIFWLKDVDKTQGAGDVFTFFFKFRADNQLFSSQQLTVVQDFVRAHRQQAGLKRTPRIQRAPETVLNMFRSKLNGQAGIGLLDFWSGAFWPSQVGLTRAEKLRQVNAFAPLYAAKIYPGVAEENRLLEEAGVHVVIVSNGDQDVAIAIAPYLGVKPENVVGSHLMYDKHRIATGVNHSYEVFDKEWEVRPQPGKALSFHYWAHANRARFGWKSLDDRKIIIAGRDGDSASSDGGMMIYLPPAALGNFMVDTPGEPDRIKKFYPVAAKYGWTRGQFFTLIQAASQSGAIPE
jgi:hypothetical protein